MRILSVYLLFLLLCVLIAVLLLVFRNKKENWWRGWRGGWRGGWGPRRYWGWNAPRYNYYYAPAIDNSCLNSCCDTDKCSQGLGCNWNDLNGKWVSGSPYQCIKYKQCLRKNRDDKDRNEKCLGEI